VIRFRPAAARELAAVAWRNALREAQIALRVIDAFDDDLATPEVDSYFRELNAVIVCLASSVITTVSST